MLARAVKPGPFQGFHVELRHLIAQCLNNSSGVKDLKVSRDARSSQMSRIFYGE